VNYLLDTHILLWILVDPDNPAETRDLTFDWAE